MIQDCLEVFKKMCEREKKAGRDPDRLILDEYIPADGTYIIVNEDGSMEEPIQIKFDKKTKDINRGITGLRELCFFDYNSKLIDMNKPVDAKKIIHSNNYLTFYVKKENVINGKLTKEIIEGYYNVLSDPRVKHSKGNSLKLYEELETELGVVDKERLERNKLWMEEHIFELPVDLSEKDYLKLFFRSSEEDYIREGKRYLLPNLFNSNNFNLELEDGIFGLPNNNMGMNAKKPYLANRNRKVGVPYLVSKEEALLQKQFFDYLANLAAAGRTRVYVDDKNNAIRGCRTDEEPPETVCFMLSIQKGKEVEVLGQDAVVQYTNDLPAAFSYSRFLRAMEKVAEDCYQKCTTKGQLESLLNEILFSKFLVGNYMTPQYEIGLRETIPKKNLLLARDRLFNWFHKGVDTGVGLLLDKICLDAIKYSIQNSYKNKAIKQMNLRLSIRRYFDLEGGCDMAGVLVEMTESLLKKVSSDAVFDFENHREYFYGVGQMVNYLIFLSKIGNKTHSLANPFFNAKTDKVIKDRLLVLFKKYDYQIYYNDKRFRKLFAMITSFEVTEAVDQSMIINGYLSDNVLLQSRKGETEA